MPEDFAQLVRTAHQHEARRDYASAVDSLERAAKVAPDAEARDGIAQIAARLEPALREVPALEGRLRALQGKSASSRLPARPVAGDDRDLALARELIVTPDLVRALRDAFVAARPPGSPAAPAAGPLALPVESIVARLLGCDLDLARTLDLALDLVLQATGAARGFVLLRDEKGRLELSRGRGIDRQDLPPELSTSILATAERTGEPVFLGNAAVDPRFAQATSVRALGLRSVACVPILDPGASGKGRDLLGLVYLDDAQASERFHEGARDLLLALARAIATPLRNARRFEAQRKALARARAGASREGAGASRVVGRSKPIRDMLDLLAKVAPEDVAVLIEGESGTGKELAARVVHELSRRAKGPFVAENLGALPATLVEAELFGVTKGAFTGADRDREGLFVRARGGTVFLDEVGELPIEGQAKLLRVLQERKVRPVGGDRALEIDARVIAATNRDLDELVRDGKFREDLLYRLRVVSVRVPPLRERTEDIPLLCEHVLEKIGAERGEPVTPLSQAALSRLVARPWRGNVRELENVLWRVALGGESAIDSVEAPPPDPDDALGLDRLVLKGEPVALEDARAAFDRAYVGLVLAQFRGHVARASRALGVTRPALWRLMKRLGIERDRSERE